tara:strand:+ start:1273 stop:1521 length:249 start_codon:yes stop_codon:yes gene_type:complete
MAKLKEFFAKVVEFYYWFIDWFIVYQELTVSYNSTYGDADDQTFVVRKFYRKQPKFLKFKTREGDTVEIRGAEGLNYRISEL